MKSILADSVFSKTIELFVHFLERIVLFNAEYDDGIAAILAVERVRLPYLEQTIRFLQRTTHGKGDLKDLVARGLSLAHEDLVAEGLVEVGTANDIDACEVMSYFSMNSCGSRESSSSASRSSVRISFMIFLYDEHSRAFTISTRTLSQKKGRLNEQRHLWLIGSSHPSIIGEWVCQDD